MTLIDIFPTILEILEISNNNSFEGKSLTHLFEKNDGSDLIAFSEGTRGFPMKSIRTGTHKYIHWIKDAEHEKHMVTQGQNPKQDRIMTRELYDLINDPKELRNIVNEEKALVSDLRKEVEYFMKHNKEVFSKSGKKLKKELKIDEETKQRLRALGYIQ